MICKEFDIIIWILTDMNYVQIKLLKKFQSKLRTSYIFSCAFLGKLYLDIDTNQNNFSPGPAADTNYSITTRGTQYTFNHIQSAEITSDKTAETWTKEKVNKTATDPQWCWRTLIFEHNKLSWRSLDLCNQDWRWSIISGYNKERGWHKV